MIGFFFKKKNNDFCKNKIMFSSKTKKINEQGNEVLIEKLYFSSLIKMIFIF